MSVNVTNKKTIKSPSSSILLKKAKQPTSTVTNTATNGTTKKNRSSSFSNSLQAAGLFLVASVSKRRSKTEATTTLNQFSAIDASSSTSLPIPATSHISSNACLNQKSGTPRISRLRPSISARPFSQFFFPVKEESTSIDEVMAAEPKKPGKNNLKNNLKKVSSPLESQTPQTQLESHHQQKHTHQQQLQLQQQKKQQQINKRKCKRHSLALDLADRRLKTSSRSSSSSSSTTLTDVMGLSSSSNISSRSSSLKTIGNQRPDLIAVADTNTEEDDPTRPMGKTLITDKRYTFHTNTKENRLSGVVNVARARTVLGLDSPKSRETRAIHVWRENVSQLLLPSTEDQIDSDGALEMYKILSSPALIVCTNFELTDVNRFLTCIFFFKPEDTLERQRFVRPLSPKRLAMAKFILNELTETERSYNQLLKLIRNVSLFYQD